jgi:hypothetical protein
VPPPIFKTATVVNIYTHMFVTAVTIIITFKKESPFIKYSDRSIFKQNIHQDCKKFAGYVTNRIVKLCNVGTIGTYAKLD